VSKWKIKLIFRGAYRLSGTGIVECLEIIDVGCNLKQFDGLTWLTLTPIFYDRSTPLAAIFFILFSSYLAGSIRRSVFKELDFHSGTSFLNHFNLWTPVTRLCFPSHCSEIKKVNVKVIDLYSASTRSVSKALRYSTHCQGITQFYLHTLRFIRKRNEPYLPLPSQPQLGLIYRPRMDGRLSRPWCEVAPAEIRTLQPPDCKSGTLPHSH